TTGGYAEQIRVPATNLVDKPANLSMIEAAAVPLTFLTAWQMLVVRAAIVPGETVLIHAAGSGVGSAGLQIANLFGARVIARAPGARSLRDRPQRLQRSAQESSFAARRRPSRRRRGVRARRPGELGGQHQAVPQRRSDRHLRRVVGLGCKHRSAPRVLSADPDP